MLKIYLNKQGKASEECVKLLSTITRRPTCSCSQHKQTNPGQSQGKPIALRSHQISVIIKASSTDYKFLNF